MKILRSDKDTGKCEIIDNQADIARIIMVLADNYMFSKGEVVISLEEGQVFQTVSSVYVARITELCPHCDTEVLLNTDFVVQGCINCLNKIKPCTLCNDIHHIKDRPPMMCKKCPLD